MSANTDLIRSAIETYKASNDGKRPSKEQIIEATKLAPNVVAICLGQMRRWNGKKKPKKVVVKAKPIVKAKPRAKKHANGTNGHTNGHSHATASEMLLSLAGTAQLGPSSHGTTMASVFKARTRDFLLAQRAELLTALEALDKGIKAFDGLAS